MGSHYRKHEKHCEVEERNPLRKKGGRRCLAKHARGRGNITKKPWLTDYPSKNLTGDRREKSPKDVELSEHWEEKKNIS